MNALETDYPKIYWTMDPAWNVQDNLSIYLAEIYKLIIERLKKTDISPPLVGGDKGEGANFCSL